MTTMPMSEVLKKTLVASALLAALTGCGTVHGPTWRTKWSATGGQLADSTTTVVALATGLAAEANPIVRLAPWLLVVKPFMPMIVAHFKKGDFYACRKSLYSSAQIGWGAATWNLGVMFGQPIVGAIVTGVQAVLMHDHRMNSASLYCFTATAPEASK